MNEGKVKRIEKSERKEDDEGEDDDVVSLWALVSLNDFIV